MSHINRDITSLSRSRLHCHFLRRRRPSSPQLITRWGSSAEERRAARWREGSTHRQPAFLASSGPRPPCPAASRCRFWCWPSSARSRGKGEGKPVQSAGHIRVWHFIVDKKKGPGLGCRAIHRPPTAANFVGRGRASPVGGSTLLARRHG